MAQRDPGDETQYHDVAGASVVRLPVLPEDVAHRIDVALMHVRRERIRQFGKWGDQRHDEGYWARVLGEEFGEQSEASLNYSDLGPLADSPKEPGVTTLDHYRKELVHVAAVAVAMIEDLDRKRASLTKAFGNMSPRERDAWRHIYAHADDETELARQQREAGQ